MSSTPTPDPLLPQHPITTEPSSRVDRITRLMARLILLCLALVVARVIQLQTYPSPRLETFISDRTTVQTEHGARGDIRDVRGRPLASTRLGYRAFVDPVNFPNPPGDAFARLADALGEPIDQVAVKIAPKLAYNLALKERTTDVDPANDPKPEEKPVRYVTISGILEDWQIAAVKNLKIPGVQLEERSVRHVPGDELAAQLLGKVGIDHDGLLGAEKMLDSKLKPADGKLTYVIDARRRPLWIEEDGFVAPQRGQDIRLSIDLEIQRIATEELNRGITDADAAGGRLIAMNPHSGEILAMVDIVRDLKDAVDYQWDHPIGQEPGGRPRYRTIKRDPGRLIEPGMARNRCVEDVYEPGSTFKPFMWANVTALGLASPHEIIDTENGSWRTPYGRPIHDVAARARQSWADVLVNSSNIGMVKGTSRLTFPQMHDAVVKLGFGSKTSIGLPGESPGLVTSLKNWTKYSQTSVAMGYEVAVTPLQMIRAFSVFARTGDDAGTLPKASLLAVPHDSASQTVPRIFPPQIAELTRRTMTGVAEALERKVLKNEAKNFRYDCFGKSGTAKIPLGSPPKDKKRPKGSDGYFQGQYNSSFICGSPVDQPKIVVLVVIDDPGPALVRANRYYGAMVAGPVARRFVERSLAYLGVEPTINKPETFVATGHN